MLWATQVNLIRGYLLKRAAHSAGPIAHCFVGWFARDGRKQMKKRQHIETSAGSLGTVAIWNGRSGYLSVCLSVRLYLSVCLSVCLFVCFSVSGLKTCGQIQIFGQNRTNIRRKSFQNPSQFCHKYRNMGPWLAFGAEERPVRYQDGPPGKRPDFFTPLCAKMVLQRSLLGFLENREWLQNQPLEARSAPGPSKNALLEGL